MQLLRDAPPEFSILAGDDAFLMPMMCLGASGGITASAHLRTETFAALAKAAKEGELEEARDHARTLAPLVSALFAEPSPTVLKGVLAAQGTIASPAVRLPLTPASHRGVDRALQV